VEEQEFYWKASLVWIGNQVGGTDPFSQVVDPNFKSHRYGEQV
jgi:hypothetical protein